MSMGKYKKRNTPINNQLRITIEDALVQTLVKYDSVTFNTVTRI